jgi:hypothetical protein
MPLLEFTVAVVAIGWCTLLSERILTFFPFKRFECCWGFIPEYVGTSEKVR